MITSRRILVATVLASLAFVGALPVAIGVKYRNSEFVNEIDSRYDYYKLKPFKVVSAKYLKGLEIVSSDSFRLEVSRDLRNSISISVADDTLSIICIGDSGNDNDSAKVTLYLPKAGTIIARECSIKLKGGVDEFPPAPSYTFDLRQSHVVIPKLAYHQFFNQLYFSGADNSSLHVSKSNHIWDLHLVNLENTVIEPSVELKKLRTSFEGKTIVESIADQNSIEIRSGTSK